MDKTKLKSYIQNNQRELRVAIRQQIQSYGPLGPVQHKRVPLKQQVKEEQQRLLDIRKKNAKQFNSNILLNKTQFGQKQQGAKRNWDASKMQQQSQMQNMLKTKSDPVFKFLDWQEDLINEVWTKETFQDYLKKQHQSQERTRQS